MHEQLDTWPGEIRTGTTVSVRRSLSHYPASEGWALAVYIARGAAQGPLEVAAVADGDAHVFNLTAEDTGELVIGWRRYVVRATNEDAGLVVDAEYGYLDVVAGADAADPRTHAERMLEVIEAVLEGRVDRAVESYTVGGRQVTRMPIAELRKLRAHYKAEVWRQRNPGQLGPRVEVQFGSAGDDDPTRFHRGR